MAGTDARKGALADVLCEDEPPGDGDEGWDGGVGGEVVDDANERDREENDVLRSRGDQGQYGRRTADVMQDSSRRGYETHCEWE